MLWIFALFGLLLLCFLAVSPGKRTTTVTKIDPATHQLVVEIHEQQTGSPARSAAQWTLGILVCAFLAIVLLAVVAGARR